MWAPSELAGSRLYSSTHWLTPRQRATTPRSSSYKVMVSQYITQQPHQQPTTNTQWTPSHQTTATRPTHGQHGQHTANTANTHSTTRQHSANTRDVRPTHIRYRTTIGQHPSDTRGKRSRHYTLYNTYSSLMSFTRIKGDCHYYDITCKNSM